MFSTLVAIDTATLEARPLTGEARSVEDHVEWLDNDTILYALPRDGETDTDPQPILRFLSDVVDFVGSGENGLRSPRLPPGCWLSGTARDRHTSEG